MLDVDHFKMFNDRFGHLAGDECLRRVAAAVAGTVLRPGDVVGRYGGEEFCMVLPDTMAAGAVHIAEQARLAIQALGIPAARDGDVVTASLGVATRLADSGLSHEGLLALADQALYSAKKSGRNRVVQMPVPSVVQDLNAVADAVVADTA
jgi:diguanylate cyclase (GGDEF)-like protein